MTTTPHRGGDWIWISQIACPYNACVSATNTLNESYLKVIVTPVSPYLYTRIRHVERRDPNNLNCQQPMSTYCPSLPDGSTACVEMERKSSPPRKIKTPKA